MLLAETTEENKQTLVLSPQVINAYLFLLKDREVRANNVHRKDFPKCYFFETMFYSVVSFMRGLLGEGVDAESRFRVEHKSLRVLELRVCVSACFQYKIADCTDCKVKRKHVSLVFLCSQSFEKPPFLCIAAPVEGQIQLQRRAGQENVGSQGVPHGLRQGAPNRGSHRSW